MSETTSSTDVQPKTASVIQNRWRAIVLNILPPALFGSLVIGGWYFISYVILSENRRFLLRPPDKVLTEGFLDWGGTGGMSEMLQSLWSSTKVAGIGLFLAILIGLFLAVLMSQAISVEKALFPFLVTLQAVPILAIVPLISFWWGTGQTSRVVVCIIISLFPIIVNTLFGLQSAEKGMHDLFTLHHVSRTTRLRKLMFPAALPALFAGLRISAGLSVVGAIVGDFFFARGEVGLGQLLKRFASRLQGEELLTSVILSAALGVAVFLLFTWIQNKAIGKWSDRAGLV
ncbi:MAG: nitrate ABC transporter permease [Acidimicrobiaceae bacterium]|nr:nitrate ABC transporter permease [Acidimicrobiaceae bacterium]MBA4810921.1 ABC transporter permease subunit [Acidimicrobiales bacterium]|tara:strand:+ start:192 stop:1052 length:861 start_codon:yes stop_codon:yes gene_type:complete